MLDTIESGLQSLTAGRMTSGAYLDSVQRAWTDYHNVPLLTAGTIVVLFPICVVYLAFQRHFIRGMLQGAVKG